MIFNAETSIDTLVLQSYHINVVIHYHSLQKISFQGFLEMSPQISTGIKDHNKPSVQQDKNLNVVLVTIVVLQILIHVVVMKPVSGLETVVLIT